MRNCFILGTGRSGTSMVAGALAQTGYACGDALHPPRAANPKGFFEAPAVNELNERLLAPMLAGVPEAPTGDGQRWLGVPPAGTTPAPSADDATRIAALTGDGPWCYKDPRFCFTLPAWRTAAPDAALVCVFRHPALTATSMVAECESADYLRGVRFDLAQAFELWTRAYREVLERHSGTGDWLFLHYDQMLTSEGRARLADLLGSGIDGAFPDPKLRREVPDVEVPAEAQELYEKLCRRAGYAAREARPHDSAPRVAVLAYLAPGDEVHVDHLRADVAAQRGVEAELVLVDATEGAALPAGAGRVVPAASVSRGAALRAALAEIDAPFVALAQPGCRSLPARLAHAIHELERGHDLVTCDYVLTDGGGSFVDRSSPAAMGDAPGPFFAAGVVARRAALEALSPLAFYPVELDLVRRLHDAGRAGHVLEPGFTVERARYLAAWEDARHDAALVTWQDRPFAGERPELTVSLCSFNRRTVLRECLESLCRQQLAPGTFEVVLVDDGSSDGTAEMLADLDYPVPVRHLRRPNGGLSAARNTGLAVARGELVLFINDDTIAFPDLVERHLAAHRLARAGRRKVAVLGSFEQPQRELGGALLRYLEGSNEVFGYADMVPGKLQDAFAFYTCNVSVPLADVRRVGGYDESFRHYGCEDTDLALRLEALGYSVVYDPRARALHRHAMDFDYVCRRAKTVARAYVRLMRKHPQALSRWNNEALTQEYCFAQSRKLGERRAALEAAADELARVDVGALEALDGDFKRAAGSVLAGLAELFAELNPVWWQEGFYEGMKEHGLRSMSELLAGDAAPWPVESRAPLCLFAAPRWDDPSSLDELMRRIGPIAGDPAVCVLLRYDPRTDAPRDQTLAALERAYYAHIPDGVDVEVVLEEAPLTTADLRRIGRTVGGFLPLGGEPDELLDALSTERLSTDEDVRAWRARFGDLDERREAPAPARRSAPELSVIVPTRERPRELAQLLARLAAQDLEPARFEVIVVDDGSRKPAAAGIDAQAYPYRLKVLRREAAGPSAARNAALAVAAGEYVLFFNDDAVPAEDALRRHLAGHRCSAAPTAVLGTFTLLPRHRRDSLAEYVETSTTLFAQPEMRPGVRYHGLAFCTGNVSLPAAAVRAVGGFDTSLPYAGGEDSELGLRLERELGMRVIFDPTVRCGHDHALDVYALAKRKRAVGWAAYRVQEKHGDLGLLPAQRWPLPDEGWEELERTLTATAEQRERALASIAALCAREVESGTGPAGLASVRELLPRIEQAELLFGALLAHHGLLPEDELHHAGGPARTRAA
ncbi:MAG: glycosyltransferase [Planctomycetota bacterium]